MAQKLIRKAYISLASVGNKMIQEDSDRDIVMVGNLAEEVIVLQFELD